LNFIEEGLALFEVSFTTQEVLSEILSYKDNVSNIINHLIEQKGLLQMEVGNKNLLLALNKNLGKGEASIIALALERGDITYVILDDYTARKTAMRLGLKVKGTLGIIRKLYDLNKISYPALQLYEELHSIGFRVKEEIFREIFKGYL